MNTKAKQTSKIVDVLIGWRRSTLRLAQFAVWCFIQESCVGRFMAAPIHPALVKAGFLLEPPLQIAWPIILEYWMRGCAVRQPLPRFKNQILISLRHFYIFQRWPGEAHPQICISKGSCGF